MGKAHTGTGGKNCKGSEKTSGRGTYGQYFNCCDGFMCAYIRPISSNRTL